MLAAIIIASAVVSQRRVSTAQQEKLEALEESQQVLGESEKKYRTLVESMEDAVFVVNSTGRIALTNTLFAALLRSIPEELVGEYPQDLFTASDGALITGGIERVFQTGKTEKIEHQLNTDDQTAWFETSLVPQYDEQGTRFSVLAIARDITQRKETDTQLQSLVTTLRSQQETLKQLSSEVLRAQEQERRRISRELHDEIGQAMTAISFNLQLIKNTSSKQSDTLEEQVQRCQQLVQKTAQEIHRFSYELRPSALDDLGLLPAIRLHVREFTEHTGINVQVEGNPVIEELDGEIKTVLYRVLQEGLNNIAKHARAQLAQVTLDKTDTDITLDIRDNGQGFDPDNQPKARPGQGGLGLVSIRERVMLIGGNVTVQSQPGQGTHLSLHIPYGNA